MPWRPAAAARRRQEAARALNRLREHWRTPPDATGAEPKTRSLINLANVHASLARAVGAACGWPGDEVPGEVAEDVIPSRLLALNGVRTAPLGR